MDSITANIFKAFDAQRASSFTPSNGKPYKTKRQPRPHINQKSKFQIMKEKFEALEWKVELPSKEQAFIPKGWRSITLRWFGFIMRDSGVDQEIIKRIIRKAAMEVCLPAYSEKSADSLIRRIFESSKNKNGWKHILTEAFSRCRPDRHIYMP